MIELTRLDGTVYCVNPHHIEYIDCTPDSTLTMLSGKRLVVREPLAVIRERIIEYRRQIGAFGNEE